MAENLSPPSSLFWRNREGKNEEMGKARSGLFLVAIGIQIEDCVHFIISQS
jgi:hypothetical protein